MIQINDKSYQFINYGLYLTTNFNTLQYRKINSFSLSYYDSICPMWRYVQYSPRNQDILSHSHVKWLLLMSTKAFGLSIESKEGIAKALNGRAGSQANLLLLKMNPEFTWSGFWKRIDNNQN